VTAVGQNRLFQNTGKGFSMSRQSRVVEGALSARPPRLTTTAMAAGPVVCNYVKWSPSMTFWPDGKDSLCTPEAYLGSTCWLFHTAGTARLRMSRPERH
jgi:hypothetical protein